MADEIPRTDERRLFWKRARGEEKLSGITGEHAFSLQGPRPRKVGRLFRGEGKGHVICGGASPGAKDAHLTTP
jgi:hypothetical protein